MHVHCKAVLLACLASLILIPLASAQKPTRPAPTSADWAGLAKLPDFTGVWEMGLGGGAPRTGAGGSRGAAPAGPTGRGAGRGGAPPAGPALTPEYAAKAQAEAAQAKKAEDNLTANCLPPGLPGIMSQPYPLEFLLTPGQVTIISEAYTQVRHVYTDGRPLPEDPDPTFYGTSVGHWEDGTLVVESVGFAPVPRGLSFPNSDKMKVVERFHLADPDTMAVETTIIDPEALTKPYVMPARTLKRHRSWTLAEYICEENNRNFVDEKGKAGINLANPNAAPR
jgi:hypothetical protein